MGKSTISMAIFNSKPLKLPEVIINFYGAMTSYSQWNHQSIVEHDDWVLSWKSIHAPSLEKSRWVKTYGSGDQTFCWKSRILFLGTFLFPNPLEVSNHFGRSKSWNRFGQNSHNNLTRNCLDLGLIITFRTGNIFVMVTWEWVRVICYLTTEAAPKARTGYFSVRRLPAIFTFLGL